MTRKIIAALLFSACVAWLPTQAVALTTVATFDPTLGQLPESVTVDTAGNFYLSMANTIQKLTPTGQLSLFAQLPIPATAFALGVKFGPDGELYASSGGFNPAEDAASVFRISASGQVTQLAHFNADTFPNDLAFDAAGNIFVTEPFMGKVWKITPQGSASVWSDSPLLAGNPTNPALIVHLFGADGIAFDRGDKNLYVGNLDAGTISLKPGPRPVLVGVCRCMSAIARETEPLGQNGIAVRQGERFLRHLPVSDRFQPIAQQNRPTFRVLQNHQQLLHKYCVRMGGVEVIGGHEVDPFLRRQIEGVLIRPLPLDQRLQQIDRVALLA